MLPQWTPVLQLGRDVPPPGFDDLPGKKGRSSGHKKPLVLVIDDERLIADTLAEILTDSGYEVRVAYESRSAFAQIKQLCPDIVISDVVMPGLNGVEIAKRLADECPDTRVLLLSGQAATTDLLQDARKQGYNFELLVKPLHPNALLKRLRSLKREE
jgi:DNA-binding response OmpR family regulator